MPVNDYHAVERRAGLILAAYQGEVTDANRWQVTNWAWAKARADVLMEWMEAHPGGEAFIPPSPGADDPMNVWAKLEKHARDLRAGLGLA